MTRTFGIHDNLTVVFDCKQLGATHNSALRYMLLAIHGDLLFVESGQ